jgi:hypothetical protein
VRAAQLLVRQREVLSVRSARAAWGCRRGKGGRLLLLAPLAARLDALDRPGEAHRAEHDREHGANEA